MLPVSQGFMPCAPVNRYGPRWARVPQAERRGESLQDGEIGPNSPLLQRYGAMLYGTLALTVSVKRIQSALASKLTGDAPSGSTTSTVKELGSALGVDGKLLTTEATASPLCPVTIKPPPVTCVPLGQKA